MIMKGAYPFSTQRSSDIRILASGLTLNFAIDAQKILKEYDVAVEIWSITSFNELFREGIKVERSNRIFDCKEKSYVENCFNQELPTIAVSEYQRSYAEQIRQWVNGDYLVLGTDGFGRSDTRAKLRNFFEISSQHLVLNSLIMLGKKKEAKDYKIKSKIKISKEAPWRK